MACPFWNCVLSSVVSGTMRLPIPRMVVGLSFSNSINAQPIEPTPKSKPKTFFVAMVFLSIYILLSVLSH